MTKNRQYRNTIRIPVTMQGNIKIEDLSIKCDILDISRHGLQVKLSVDDDKFSIRALFDIQMTIDGKEIKFSVMLKRVMSITESFSIFGVIITSMTHESKRRWDNYIDKVIDSNFNALDGKKMKWLENQLKPSFFPSAQTNDQRQEERFSLLFFVRIKSMTQLDKFVTHDISRSGLFIHTPIILNLNQVLDIVIIHPKTEEELIVSGRVVRFETMGRQGMGIQFAKLTKEQIDQLEIFIAPSRNHKNMENDLE